MSRSTSTASAAAKTMISAAAGISTGASVVAEARRGGPDGGNTHLRFMEAAMTVPGGRPADHFPDATPLTQNVISFLRAHQGSTNKVLFKNKEGGLLWGPWDMHVYDNAEVASDLNVCGNHGRAICKDDALCIRLGMRHEDGEWWLEHPKHSMEMTIGDDLGCEPVIEVESAASAHDTHLIDMEFLDWWATDAGEQIWNSHLCMRDSRPGNLIENVLTLPTLCHWEVMLYSPEPTPTPAPSDSEKPDPNPQPNPNPNPEETTTEPTIVPVTADDAPAFSTASILIIVGALLVVAAVAGIVAAVVTRRKKQRDGTTSSKKFQADDQVQLLALQPDPEQEAAAQEGTTDQGAAVAVNIQSAAAEQAAAEDGDDEEEIGL